MARFFSAFIVRCRDSPSHLEYLSPLRPRPMSAPFYHPLALAKVWQKKTPIAAKWNPHEATASRFLRLVSWPVLRAGAQLLQRFRQYQSLSARGCACLLTAIHLGSIMVDVAGIEPATPCLQSTRLVSNPSIRHFQLLTFPTNRGICFRSKITRTK